MPLPHGRHGFSRKVTFLIDSTTPESVLLSNGKVVFEHQLKQAITGPALCTVCIRCWSLWWTPEPLEDRENYHPRYCEKENPPTAGVFVMLEDAKGKAWQRIGVSRK